MTPAQLKQARTALDWSQERLAQRLGVTATTLARWERGETTIGHPEMLRLALERLTTAEEEC